MIGYLKKILGNHVFSSQYYAKKWLGPDAEVVDLRRVQEKKEGWELGLHKLQDNRHFRLMLSVENHLQKVELHTEMLKFTVGTLEHFMKRVVGLTATPFNKDGMDPRMSDNFIPSKSMESTKTLIRRSSVKLCPDAIRMKHYLQTVAAEKMAHGLMDPNALLVDSLTENSTNQNISGLILQGARSAIKQVVYWEIKESQWKAIDRKVITWEYDNSKHKNTETFFYFDQARSRGTDLPLPKYCHVDVLIDKNCTITELKQAGERCRKAKSGTQHLNLLVPKEWEEGVIPLTGEHVIEMVERNQLKQLGELLPLMAKRQIFEICRERFFKVLHKQCEGKQELVNKYKSLLVEQVDRDTMTNLSSLSPTPSVYVDLIAYKNLLLFKYIDLLKPRDKKAINTVVEKCVKALGSEAGGKSRPNFDLKVQSIHTIQSQQQLQSQVLLEKEKQNNLKTGFWPALMTLKNEGMNEFYTSKNFISIQIINNNLFTAVRASKLIEGSKTVNCIWLSHFLINESISRNVLLESINDSAKWGRVKLSVYQRLYQGRYVLRLQTGDTSKNVQHLLLSAPEADIVVAALKEWQCLYSIHSDDGKAIYPRTAIALSDPIVCAIALINGNPDILPSDAHLQHMMGSGERKTWLGYLKHRLSKIKPGDPRHYNENRLIKLLT